MKKLDKDSLQKNRFWIGLGGFALIWLIALIVLLCSGDSSGQEKIDAARKKLTSITNPKNINHLKPLEQKYQVLNKQKDVVWAQAWDAQKEMMQWPVPEQDSEYWEKLSTDASFGDKLKDEQLTTFPKLYASVLTTEEIRQIVDPSAVELKQGAIKKPSLTKAPTSEECWYAMEDVTVQRELLGVVRAALDSVGNFDNLSFFRSVPPPPEDKTPEPTKPDTPPTTTTPPSTTGPVTPPAPGAEEPAKKIVVRRSFRNLRWQLDLVLERDEKKVVTLTTKTKLTNITSDTPSKTDPEVAGLTFLLAQDNAPKDSKPAEFTVAGEGKVLTLQKPVTLPAVTLTDPQPTPTLYVRVKDESTPEKQKQRMRSANWEVELVLERLKISEKVKGTDRFVDKMEWCVSPTTKIKNVSISRRTLPVAVSVLAVGHPTKGWYPIAFPSDPLPWMGTTTLKTPTAVPALNGLTEPVMLHQVFNPLTSPVKSVDDIVIHANSSSYDASSHRTKNRPLMKASKKFQIEEAKAADTPAATGGGAGGNASGGMSAPPPGIMPGGVPGVKGAGANPGDGTPENGLPRTRYSMITDQVRLMPVAMKLTVDQAYVQDVLTAVANSRLRIEVTQVQEERAHGVVLTSSPPKPSEGSGGDTPVVGGGMGGAKLRPGGGFPPMGGSKAGPPAGGFPGISIGSTGSASGGMPMFGGSQVYGGLPGGMGGGFGGGFPGGSANAATDEEDPNLVTLVIYGIATLYERYKSPASAAAGGPKPAKP
jgi:hypothetical protein